MFETVAGTDRKQKPYANRAGCKPLPLHTLTRRNGMDVGRLRACVCADPTLCFHTACLILKATEINYKFK